MGVLREISQGRRKNSNFKVEMGGIWVAQSVKHLILSFRSGGIPRVMALSTVSGSALNVESAKGYLSSALAPMCMRALSLK